MKHLFFVFLAVFLLWGFSRAYNINCLQKNCVSYLKKSANANNTESAREELETALNFLIKNHINDSGYTSIIYKTQDENVSLWYNNILSAYKELSIISIKGTQLEKSNILIKLRKIILLNNGDGIDSNIVVYPSGLSVFPDNSIYCIWGFVSFVLTMVFGFMWLKR